MQEISEIFDACKQEIDNSGSDICFELGSEHFISERDYEEIKILFNLARISIENPGQKIASEELLTSDLRKISNAELEKVLIATEKAIDIPVISLSAIKQDNARKISKFLLASDDKDSTYLFKAHAKKTIRASSLQRMLSFLIDFICSSVIACCLSWLLVETCFTELKNFNSHLPLISLLVSNLGISMILYPLLAHMLFRNTLGNGISRIKLAGKNSARVSLPQVFLRHSLLPLSIVSFSIFNILLKKEPLHDYLAGVQVIK